MSRLAEQVGTSADTVRYYERIGLLPEPDRSPSGYRLYDDDAVERVRFIKRAQRFGLRLEDIGELLEVRERGLCPCGHTRQLLERRAAQLDEELVTISRLRDDIRRMLAEAPAGDEGWRCASGTLQIGSKPEITKDMTEQTRKEL